MEFKKTKSSPVLPFYHSWIDRIRNRSQSSDKFRLFLRLVNFWVLRCSWKHPSSLTCPLSFSSGERKHPCSENLSVFQKKISKHIHSEGMCLWRVRNFLSFHGICHSSLFHFTFNSSKSLNIRGNSKALGITSHSLGG